METQIFGSGSKLGGLIEMTRGNEGGRNEVR